MIPTNEYEWRDRYLETRIFNDRECAYWSLKRLAEDFQITLSEQPLVKRLFLENVMRHYESNAITPAVITGLCLVSASTDDDLELSFYPSRVLMQDYTGVPAIADLAAMRDAVAQAGGDPQKINPICPVDLVIDHSVIVDRAGSDSAVAHNRQQETMRNHERYQFLKWAQHSFDNLTIIPPGQGICHQVNLEYLAKVVREDQGVLVPDTLVGTDSHTTMINGLGVLGWGVGGIEAEAAMLGQPISLNLPKVVGVKLEGALRPGVTATDLVLTITERLRVYGVVGKYIEFYGSGILNLSVADRATIANMAPEYGATCGLFPIDEKVIDYLTLTNRPQNHIEQVRAYCITQGLWYDANTLDPTYTEGLLINLFDIEPSVAGPKRPQDRMPLNAIKRKTLEEIGLSGGNISNIPNTSKYPFPVADGDVVIAAITSCTNTSNPRVMLLAGLLAKAAVEKGLSVKAHVKTSLAPGSQAVARYLDSTGLQTYLDRLGFQRVGFGCTTCIGNSGPLNENIETQIEQHQLNVCAVLSGNRNFEGRIHQAVRLNWLASPPLVVAFALAGHTRIDLDKEPLGQDPDGGDIYLSDLWPSELMLADALKQVTHQQFLSSYQNINTGDESWEALAIDSTICYPWNTESTYIQSPPFFKRKITKGSIKSARILAILGDSITTDHISPAGQISSRSAAGQYLLNHHIEPVQFNSYGSRRGNHEVMVRGTFANQRIKNKMVAPEQGGVTRYFDSHGNPSPVISIYDASRRYIANGTPLVVFAGKEYGTGSSRDWAAKGCLLLNVKAVVAESFERIHRSNLVGMGILPLQLTSTASVEKLALVGNETVSIAWRDELKPRQILDIVIQRDTAKEDTVSVVVRIENRRELDYFNAGGVLCYVANQFSP
ncbi:MAG: aconitate hydratase AcnA [Methylococcales bacterium]